MPGLQLFNHAAEWEGQVLKATEPWESTVQVAEQDWPQNSRTIGYANPFSGGVVWDEQHKPSPSYRAWYVCGSEAEGSKPNQTIPGCCYAESTDGRRWTKPAVGTGPAAGTNIVLQESFDGNVVCARTDSLCTRRARSTTAPPAVLLSLSSHGLGCLAPAGLDHEAARPEERYVMATIPKNLGYSQYHILTSPDGTHWTSRRNGSGTLQDRSTFFKCASRFDCTGSLDYVLC